MLRHLLHSITIEDLSIELERWPNCRVVCDVQCSDQNIELFTPRVSEIAYY